MIDLSVIVVSFNTKDTTLQTIHKIQNALSKGHLNWEIIVVDNHSQDGSVEALLALADGHRIHVLVNKENKGFGKPNNQGVAVSKGRYILYLNSDLHVPETPFLDDLINKMDAHIRYGALTVRVNLANGALDPASHRGFPTVWRSFCYYAGLEKITAPVPFLNRIFGGYHLTSKSLNVLHEIDAPTGAFFLVKRHIVETLGGFDEQFFMYGEDLDLAYRIKKLGYCIVYDPAYTVVHLKYQSGLQSDTNTLLRQQTRAYFYDSMAIFYRKHYERKYPQWISRLVYSTIHFKKTR